MKYSPSPSAINGNLIYQIMNGFTCGGAVQHYKIFFFFNSPGKCLFI